MADIGCFSGGGRNSERENDYFFAFLAGAAFFFGAVFLEATFSTFLATAFLAAGFEAADFDLAATGFEAFADAFAGAFTDLVAFVGAADLLDLTAVAFAETGFAFLLAFAASAGADADFFIDFLPLNAADQPSL